MRDQVEVMAGDTLQPAGSSIQGEAPIMGPGGSSNQGEAAAQSGMAATATTADAAATAANDGATLGLSPSTQRALVLALAQGRPTGQRWRLVWEDEEAGSATATATATAVVDSASVSMAVEGVGLVTSSAAGQEAVAVRELRPASPQRQPVSHTDIATSPMYVDRGLHADPDQDQDQDQDLEAVAHEAFRHVLLFDDADPDLGVLMGPHEALLDLQELSGPCDVPATADHSSLSPWSGQPTASMAAAVAVAGSDGETEQSRAAAGAVAAVAESEGEGETKQSMALVAVDSEDDEQSGAAAAVASADSEGEGETEDWYLPEGVELDSLLALAEQVMGTEAGGGGSSSGKVRG